MYTWMKASKDIRASVKYPIMDKADQKTRGKRVEAAVFGGGLIDTGDTDTLIEQFEYYLHLAGRQHMKDLHGEYPIQAWTRVISFSKNEIDPANPEGAFKVLEVAQKVQEELCPDALYLAIAQKDGKSHLWHCHIVQNAVHSSTLKACAGREVHSGIFAEQADKIAEKCGITLDYGEDHTKRDKKREKAKEMREKAKKETGYSWMEDLRLRVIQAIHQAVDKDDYEEKLQANGVTVTRKTKSGWTYQLSECEHEECIGKKARYDKFNTEKMDFSQPTLNKLFAKNYRAMIAKGLDPKTGARIGTDISDVKSADGRDFDHGLAE